MYPQSTIDRPDLDSNTRMFKGLRSRFAPRGPYSPYETSLPQLNQWLLERYLTPPARRLSRGRPAPSRV